jgi:hypothetical protein
MTVKGDMTAYWVSTPGSTVLMVVNQGGIIVRCAPYARKWALWQPWTNVRQSPGVRQGARGEAEGGEAAMSAEHREPEIDEGQPLPLDEEHEAPQFATVRMVEVRRGEGWAQETRWHPEMRAGQQCPQCERHKLKRHRSTLYCGFCRQRWWSRRPG